MTGIWFLVGDKDFYLYHSVHTDCCVHQATCPMVLVALPQEQSDWNMKIDHVCPLNAEVWGTFTCMSSVIFTTTKAALCESSEKCENSAEVRTSYLGTVMKWHQSSCNYIVIVERIVLYYYLLRIRWSSLWSCMCIVKIILLHGFCRHRKLTS